MATKFGVTFKGLDDYIKKLEEVGDGKIVKETVEEAMKVSKRHVTEKLKKGISPSSLPAKGKYSNAPHVSSTLDTSDEVEWAMGVGEINVGFDLKKPAGLTSIFLMYGTPKHRPAKGLKAAVYGAATRREVIKLEEEAFNDAIKRIMEGK